MQFTSDVYSQRNPTRSPRILRHHIRSGSELCLREPVNLYVGGDDEPIDVAKLAEKDGGSGAAAREWLVHHFGVEIPATCRHVFCKLEALS